MKYSKLKALVLDVVGFELPVSPPLVGKQFLIKPPYAHDTNHTYAEANRIECGHIIGVYFGNGEVYLNYKETNEEYHFRGDGQYTKFREKAMVKRDEERCNEARKLYSEGVNVELNGHPVLAGLGFKSLPSSKHIANEKYYVPSGVIAGDIKEHGGNLLQAFWAYESVYGESSFEVERVMITAVRAHGLEGVTEHPNHVDVRPSIHVHQFSPSTRVVCTVGLKNALQLRKDFPSFTIVEAYCLKHLHDFVEKRGLKGCFHGDKPYFVALESSEQIEKFEESSKNNVLSDEYHLDSIKQRLRSRVDGQLGEHHQLHKGYSIFKIGGDVDEQST